MGPRSWLNKNFASEILYARYRFIKPISATMTSVLKSKKIIRARIFPTNHPKFSSAHGYLSPAKPYIGVRFMDQVKAVIPLAVYLFIFQIVVLQQAVENSWSIIGGLFAVMVGLMFFMEGLKLGLMPFGESIGNILPKKCRMWVVLSVAFALGVLVTYAEPAIGALQEAGKLIEGSRAPYLFVLLNHMTFPLVMSVGAGVGLAAVMGTLRFIYGWSLKPLATASVAITLSLTTAMLGIPELTPILGLAWDCGAVTTGPVTVPLVLSLGIGVAAAAGKGENSLSGFGIVTLASLFPIIAVLCLGLYTYMTVPSDEILRLSQMLPEARSYPRSLCLAQSYSRRSDSRFAGNCTLGALFVHRDEGHSARKNHRRLDHWLRHLPRSSRYDHF